MQKKEITNFFVYSLIRLVRFAHEIAHTRHNQVNLPLLSLNRNFSRLVDCSLRSVGQQAIIDILN